MNTTVNARAAQRIGCDAFVDMLEPGATIQFGVWYGEPYGVINAINRKGADKQPLYINSNIHTAAADYFHHPNAHCFTSFYGAQERASQSKNGNVFYTPTQFTDFQRLLRHYDPVDYLIYRTRPADENGLLNCSLTSSWEYKAIQFVAEHHPETKIVIETNSKLPKVNGIPELGGNNLPVSVADFIVEDESDLFCFPIPEPSAVEHGIAKNVAALIENGATLQLGFGGVPMAVGQLLTEKRDLGIHTEMFCEAHIDLIEAGAVTNAHKGLYNGVSVATFALGGKRLHDWIADNDQFAMLPVEEVNRVTVLAKLNNMTGVNSVLTIDLSGQACAHCLGPATYSGIGGAFEFAYGSTLSPGGKYISCLPSTATLKDGTVVSNIVPEHPQGARITTPEHSIDWVVTEYGAAWLKYLNLDQRAAALVDIAHPDFREDLIAQAEAKGLRLNKIRALPAPPERFFVRANG